LADKLRAGLKVRKGGSQNRFKSRLNLASVINSDGGGILPERIYTIARVERLKVE
jgi:hypothetical protein